MMNLKYITLVLAIFQYVKADTCGGPVGNINDCLTKEASINHYGCCGVKFKYSQYYSKQACIPLPKSQSGRDFYLTKILKDYKILDKSDLELVCPEVEKEIKGYCTDYSYAMLDKGSDCFGLSLDNLKEQMHDDLSSLSCCVVRNNNDSNYDDLNSVFYSHVNVCMPLPKDKAIRDENMKKWLANLEEQNGKPLPFTYDDLTIECGN